MDANFGGTNIFSPMKDVLENKNSNAFKVGDEVILSGLTGFNVGMNGMSGVVKTEFDREGRQVVKVQTGMEVNALSRNMRHAKDTQPIAKHQKNRIFLLTDGQVGNK